MKNKDSVLIRAKSSDVVHSVIYKKVSLDRVIHDVIKKIHVNDVPLFKNICYGTIRFHWELKSKIKMIPPNTLNGTVSIITAG